MQRLQAQQGDDAQPDDEAEEEICEVWPEHWDAMRLLGNCIGLLPVAIGSMGGAIYQPLPSSDLQPELRWLGIQRKRQAELVVQYRTAEAAACRILNQRVADAQAKSQPAPPPA